MFRHRFSFSVGQRIVAQLVEQTGDRNWIASFNGHLIGVKNSTACPLKKGESVELEIRQIQPLTLLLVGKSEKRQRHLRVSI